MKITARTPRRHTINLLNDCITIYNEAEDGFGSPFALRAFTEWCKAGMDRKYGLGTKYQGLVIIDGLEKYVDEAEPGCFTVKVGDKLVPFATDKTVDELLEDGEKLYTVMDVSVYTMRGALLSVEVTCG